VTLPSRASPSSPLRWKAKDPPPWSVSIGRRILRFYRAAAAIVRPRLRQWRGLWQDGARRAAQDTADQMDALDEGDVAHLLLAGVHARTQPVETGRLGMCGLLETYPAAPREVT
jgi:hypothetical protein